MCLLEEAYPRRTRADRTEVESPRADLTSIVSRLSTDHLRSTRARRAQYVGPWIPKPLVEEPSSHDALSESLPTAFLIMLQSPNASRPVEMQRVADNPRGSGARSSVRCRLWVAYFLAVNWSDVGTM
jgi:hypothetical protein